MNVTRSKTQAKAMYLAESHPGLIKVFDYPWKAQAFWSLPDTRIDEMVPHKTPVLNVHPMQLEPGRVSTTVSGWTRINARFHPGQNRRSITQNHRSEAENRGC